MNVPQGTQRKKKANIQPHAYITLNNVSVWSSSTRILNPFYSRFIYTQPEYNKQLNMKHC